MIDVDGFGVALDDSGPGPEAGEPPVVLLHGFGASRASWRRVAAGLAPRRVVAFDRPGFGASPLRPARGDVPPPLTSEAAGAFTLRVLDVLGLDRAVLAGHSAGALVALEAALAEPSRVAALGLVAPVVEGGPPRAARLVAGLPGTAAVFGAAMRLAAPRLLGRALRATVHDRSVVDDEMVAGYSELLAQPGWAEGLWAMTAGWRPSTVPARLAEVTVPAVVVAGEHDRIARPERCRELALALPRARFVVVPGAGHVVPEEAPGAVAAALRSVLAP